MSEYFFRDLVIDSRTGLNPRKNFVLGNGDNFYVTIKDIHDGKIFFSDKTDRVDDEAIALIKRRSRIKNGDVLFVSIGRIGETAIVHDKDDSWDVNESVFIFTLDTDIIDAEYFCHLMRSRTIQDRLQRDSSGSTFKSIKMKQLEKMSFDVPKIEKQKVVVKKLSKIAEQIAICNTIIKKMDFSIKARFVEMFGDPVTNPKMWNIDTTERHIDLLSGFPFKSEDYVDEGINICGGLIIMPQRIEWKDCVHWATTEGYEEYLLNQGDIVMALDRPWISEGFKIARIDGDHLPALLIQRTARIRAVDVNQDYLYYCFINGGFDKHSNITGSLVPHISAKDIKSFKIMLPPPKLQDEFSAFVKQVDKSKSVVQNILDKLTTLQASLMQEYFG